MRKRALLWIVLLLGLAAGCGTEKASPTPSPAPSPTTAAASDSEPTAIAPTVAPSSGPASCMVEPLEFPTNPNIPPVTEDDHSHGPADAPITFIEYADFQ